MEVFVVAVFPSTGSSSGCTGGIAFRLGRKLKRAVMVFEFEAPDIYDLITV